jgi:very-short-patch-repair endonuclease
MNNKKHLRIHPQVRQRARELRQPLTPAEERLWQTLRSRQIQGYKFRRQHPLGRFIVDFYCASLIRFENKAVIEDLGTVIEKIVRVCQRLEGAKQARNIEIEG